MKKSNLSYVAMALFIGVTACTGRGTGEDAKVDKVQLNALEAEKADEALSSQTKKFSKKSDTTKKNRAPAAARETVSSFIVSIGAYRIKENAEKIFNQLKTEGFPVTLQAKGKEGNLYLVQLTPTSDKEQAQKWADQLKTKSSIAAQILIR
jgi:cell division septation protein DedD